MNRVGSDMEFQHRNGYSQLELSGNSKAGNYNIWTKSSLAGLSGR